MGRSDIQSIQSKGGLQPIKTTTGRPFSQTDSGSARNSKRQERMVWGASSVRGLPMPGKRQFGGVRGGLGGKGQSCRLWEKRIPCSESYEISPGGRQANRWRKEWSPIRSVGTLGQGSFWHTRQVLAIVHTLSERQKDAQKRKKRPHKTNHFSRRSSQRNRKVACKKRGNEKVEGAEGDGKRGKEEVRNFKSHSSSKQCRSLTVKGAQREMRRKSAVWYSNGETQGGPKGRESNRLWSTVNAANF